MIEVQIGAFDRQAAQVTYPLIALPYGGVVNVSDRRTPLQRASLCVILTIGELVRSVMCPSARGNARFITFVARRTQFELTIAVALIPIPIIRQVASIAFAGGFLYLVFVFLIIPALNFLPAPGVPLVVPSLHIDCAIGVLLSPFPSIIAPLIAVDALILCGSSQEPFLVSLVVRSAISSLASATYCA